MRVRLLVRACLWLSVTAGAFSNDDSGKHLAGVPRQWHNDTKLSFHPAAQPNGVGVLVVPGGGYSHVSLDYEGANTTAYLNERGYDAWVLNYSVGSTTPTPLYPKPLDEALDAVRYIRALNRTSKLGIWGYSAGGHLSAMTVTNPEAELDFGILAYPVISMQRPYTHLGSHDSLLGVTPQPDLEESTSAQNRVSSVTPPIFLFHTANDPTVHVQNSLLFANAMSTNGRPFQLLVLPDGRHGIALALDDPVRNWTPELERWMEYSI